MINLVWCTQPKMYVCEIRGAVGVTFVTEENRTMAMDFKTVDKANSFRPVLEEMSGVTLSIELEEDRND